MNQRAGRASGALGAVALQLLSCGGGSSDPCATGECTLPGRTVVSWILNHHPELMFPNDTCQDLGVVTMRAELVGIEDPTQVAVQEVGCSQGQATFFGLAPGNYQVSLTPLDASFGSLVTAPVAAEVPAGSPGADTQVTVNVPYDAWTQAYTGTFLFRLAWGGLSCEQTVPSVATQTLRLVAGGTVVGALTDSGQRLDGTDPRPCRPLSESFAQFAPENPQDEPGLPFGPATLHVVGQDTVGNVMFDHVFDTFVGAAQNNPTITFDLPGPDAGVDAPPDAAIDAAPDAPIDAASDAAPDAPDAAPDAPVDASPDAM